MPEINSYFKENIIRGNKDLNKVSNLFSTICSLLSEMGEIKMMEFIYTIYIKIVEAHYGKDHILAGNCYFMIGIFYFKNVVFFYYIYI